MPVQLEAFAPEEARDRHLEVGLKPAGHVGESARLPRGALFTRTIQTIDPDPRYGELLTQPGPKTSGPARGRGPHGCRTMTSAT